MSKVDKIALGLDFGTESVRALLVDLAGNERGSAASRYRHGQIIDALSSTGETLPAEFALQHPADWLEGAAKVVRAAVKSAGVDAQQVIGVGVDFTSCTMLPATADGAPLCLTEKWSGEKYAWPKLWKHHAAHEATARINQVARRRKEPWLARYGGVIGLEWFFPKILETLTAAPAVYQAADVWIEAGDWFVWQLVGGAASQLPRSTCQAGYKAMWNKHDGYPSAAFFKAVDPRLQQVIAQKMPGVFLAPGEQAGELTAEMARKLGLTAGTPVSAATIDAHAGVPGAGAAEPGTLVMVMGTSSCHMLNAAEEHLAPGIAGVVDGGILPGLFGYETGQAAVGDAFDWLRQLVGAKDFGSLTQAAAQLPPGAEGVRCVDWFHGCRTPLMDGALRGAFTGLSLGHRPHHLYRALLEASACGVRWIVELLEEHGVPVRKCLATGGLPHHNPLLVQIYADVLGRMIEVPPSKQGPALGAAILAALAAGRAATGFSSPPAAIRAMAAPVQGNSQRQRIVVKPNRK
ncbi:MAG: ribulokinase, partial [Pirellulales bacterium]